MSTIAAPDAFGNVSEIGPNKAIASLLGGVIITIVVWVVTVIWPGFTVPPNVAAAFTTLVSVALVWCVPHKRRPACRRRRMVR